MNIDNNDIATQLQHDEANMAETISSARKANIGTNLNSDPEHTNENNTASDNTNNDTSQIEMIDLTSSPECDSEPSFVSATDGSLPGVDTEDKTSQERPQPVLKDYSSMNAQQKEQISEEQQQATSAKELNEPAIDTPKLGTYEMPIIVRLASAAHNNEPYFKFGPYIPFTRHGSEILIHPDGIVKEYVDVDQHDLAKKLNREMLPEDSIIEAPSLVTPFLLKKRTKWPSKTNTVDNLSIEQQTNPETNSNCCDSNGTSRKDIEFDQQKNEFIYCNQIVNGNHKKVEIVKLIYRRETDDLLSLPSEATTNGTISRNDSASNCSNLNMRPVRDYVREATVLGLTKDHQLRDGKALALQDFSKTRVSDMLLNIGLNQVKEFTLNQDIKRLNWEVKHNEDKCIEHIEDLDDMKQIMDRLKAFNKQFKSTIMYPCDQCDFKTNTMMAYLAHKEVPHVKNRNFCCNWCQFKTRDTDALTFHTIVSHKKRCRFEMPHKPIKCDHCSFESTHKKRATNHIEACRRAYNQDNYLGRQLFDYDFPPAITMKPITREDVICYDRILKEVRLSGRKPSSIRVDQTSSSSQFNKRRCNNTPNMNTNGDDNSKNNTVDDVSIISEWNPQQPRNNNCNVAHMHPNNHHNSTHAKRTYSSLNGNRNNFINNNDNSNNNNNNNNNIPLAGKRMRYGTARSGSESPTLEKDSTFVICEICDSYISDLQQLRIHMQIIHKIKLQSKILESRPPLTCGRCGWRFFTDQGLERHLLGLHGLVTTNLQDQVDQELDAGRCTKCGRAFANKLVLHMKDVHKIVLKSACLAYKCIICGAVFNLYRLFENHVYSVHGDAIKQTPKVK